MYRPGSVTRPTCAQVILLTANHFPFAFNARVHQEVTAFCGADQVTKKIEAAQKN